MRERVLELARGALASIEAQRPRIDDLNVYPVPDGDTGTNLTLTVRAVVEALEATGPTTAPALAKEVSRAALMGARGNSGVILSQIVRGATESLGGDRRPGARVPLGERRRLPRGQEAGRGDDADRDPRAGRRRGARRRPRRRRRARATTASCGRARCCRCCARRASSTRARPASSRSCAASPPRSPARRCPRRRRGRGASWASTRSTRSSRRYRYCTVFVVEGDELDADGARGASSSSSATRCSWSATPPR